MRKDLLFRLRSFEFRRYGKVDKKNSRLLSLDTWLVPLSLCLWEFASASSQNLIREYSRVLACCQAVSSQLHSGG